MTINLYMDSAKPRLWIISELFPPEETSTAYIMGEIANAMTSKYDVKVICGPEIYDSSKKGNAAATNSSLDVIRVNGIKEDKNNKFSRIRKFLLMSRRLYCVANKNIQKGDNVLMVSNPFPLILFMAYLRTRRNFNLNMLVHDVFPESLYTDIKIPRFFNLILSSLFNRSYATADQLIAIGRDMKEILSIKTKGRTSISIIENWADITNIHPRPQSSNFNDKIVIQYAGNIGKAQGVSNIVDFIKDANNPKLIFEVWGNGSVIDNVKEKIVSYNLSEKVSLKGTYLRSEQDRVLSHCDIAIVTLVEGMYGLGTPSKSYNILAAGKPILYIGEKNTEIWLMVEEYNIGFCFLPSDNNGIIHFLSTVSKEQLNEMGVRARKLAEQRYSKEIILNKFCDII